MRRFALPHWAPAFHVRRIVRCGQAQSLVEMALIMPVFLMLAFGFMTLSLIVFSMGNANFASRAAVRYAMTHSSTSYFPSTQQGLNNIVAPYIFKYPSNTYSITPGYYANFTGGGTNVVGDGVCITVTISYPYSVLGKIFKNISYSSMGCSIILQ